MKTLKIHINTACISFTLNIIVVLIFERIGISGQMNNAVIWLLIALHGLLSLAQYFIDIIPLKGEPSIALRWAITAAIVLIFGTFTNLIGRSFVAYLITFLMTILIYASVAWIIFTKDQSDATRINKKLQEKNRE